MLDLVQDPPLRVGEKRVFYGQATAPSGSTITLSAGGTASIYGYPTRVKLAATSATQTLQDTSAFVAADVLFFQGAAVNRTVSSVTDANVLVLTASVTTVADEHVMKVIANAVALTGFSGVAGTGPKYWYNWDTTGLVPGIYAIVLTNAGTGSDNIARNFEETFIVRVLGATL